MEYRTHEISGTAAPIFPPLHFMPALLFHTRSVLTYTSGMNIVLIGYRGSGKSTVGKRLANKLWIDFIDTDKLITDAAGMTIRTIFEKEGEAGFRKREVEAVAQAAARDNVIIAVGGGAILDPQNVAALKKNGKIIWLEAKAEVLHERIQNDSENADSRPQLVAGVSGGMEEIRQLLEVRTPADRAAADVTLEVSNLTADDAATRIVSFV